MQGQDIALLLKLSLPKGKSALSKDLARDLYLSPSEISKSLLAEGTRRLLQEPRFLEVLPGFVNGDAASQQRVPLIERRLETVSHLA